MAAGDKDDINVLDAILGTGTSASAPAAKPPEQHTNGVSHGTTAETPAGAQQAAVTPVAAANGAPPPKRGGGRRTAAKPAASAPPPPPPAPAPRRGPGRPRVDPEELLGREPVGVRMTRAEKTVLIRQVRRLEDQLMSAEGKDFGGKGNSVIVRMGLKLVAEIENDEDLYDLYLRTEGEAGE